MNTTTMLPITFDLAKYPTVDTIRLLASLLERMTLANDLLNKQQQQVVNGGERRGSLQQQTTSAYTRFHARLVPSIDIYSYLSRILKYCPCANECFLSLLVYFDRMSKNSLALTGKPFTIDSFNIHRLIIAGVMVASKFFSDVFYTNTRYAKVGGLPVTELNNLEIEFLKLNSFNLTVPICELQKYGDQLLKVGYMNATTASTTPINARHSRSSSFDTSRLEMDRVIDLTQRMSLDERVNNNNKYYYQQQQQQGQQPHYNSYPQQKRNSQPIVRKMTSTNSLKEGSSRYNNGYYDPLLQQQQQQQQATNKQPRHSRSSINLYQGFWKPNSPLQQQTSTNTKEENKPQTVSRRLSVTSIHAPPFIPSNELQQQIQQQQLQQQQQQQYYYSNTNGLIGGIPTPPPSASPIQYHNNNHSSSSLHHYTTNYHSSSHPSHHVVSSKSSSTEQLSYYL